MRARPVTASDVTGATVRRLMSRHRVTVAEVARHWNLPQSRVRAVRKAGGPWDWPLMIQQAAESRESESPRRAVPRPINAR